MKKKLGPIKLRVLDGKEAWAYINERSIDVFIHHEKFGVVSARITQKQIEKWMEEDECDCFGGDPDDCPKHGTG
jgi:hypothetical protein